MFASKKLVYTARNRSSYNKAIYQQVQTSGTLDTPPKKCLSFRDLIDSILGQPGGAGGSGLPGGDGGDGGCGCSDPAAVDCGYNLAFAEYQDTGVNLRMAISDTPKVSKVWQIFMMSGYDTTGAGGGLGFFLIPAGVDPTFYTKNRGSGTVIPVPTQCMRIGIGHQTTNTNEFTTTAGTNSESSPINAAYPIILSNQWRVMALGMSAPAASHTVGLRIVYNEVNCNSVLNPVAFKQYGSKFYNGPPPAGYK